jgi:hypothetical protein
LNECAKINQGAVANFPGAEDNAKLLLRKGSGLRLGLEKIGFTAALVALGLAFPANAGDAPAGTDHQGDKEAIGAPPLELNPVPGKVEKGTPSPAPSQAESAPEKAEDKAEDKAPSQKSRYSVLVMDLKPTNADPDEVTVITQIVANSFSKHNAFNVLSGQDVSSAIGLEAQKQAMGCDEQTCLAEIAGALGADFVVFGTAGKLGQLFVVNLSLYDSAGANSAGRGQIEARNLELLPKEIDRVVNDMAFEITGVRVEDDPVAQDGAGISPLLLGGMTTAALGVGGAGLFYFLAFMNEGDLDNPDSTNKGDALFWGRTFVGLAAFSGLVGLGGLGAGVYGAVE